MKRIIPFILLISLSLSALSQQNGMGLNFDDEAYEKIPISAPLIKGDYDLPTSFSLEKYCPTPGSQGITGTCTGWATAYGARTIIEAKQNNVTWVHVDDYVFSPSFIYEQIKDPSDNDCRKGSSINAALQLMKTVGAVKLEDLPFQCSTEITPELINMASDHKILDYKKLFSSDSPDQLIINSVKKAISEGKPVVIGMNTPDSFHQALSTWEPSPTEDPDVLHGGHALTVMAYDDTKEGGAFKILNSWGKHWADRGYCWIKYDDFSDFVKYGYELIEMPKANPEPLEVVLSGEMVFELEDGGTMAASSQVVDIKNLDVVDDDIVIPEEKLVAYLVNKEYPSGTRFRINMTTNKESYLYALATDLSGKINTIFPPDESNISPYISYSESTIAFPAENMYIRMDENPGRDYLCLLYSREELDLGEIIKKMEDQTGTFSERILAALHGKLIPIENIKYKDGIIGFDAVITNMDNYIVPLMVELVHK